MLAPLIAINIAAQAPFQLALPIALSLGLVLMVLPRAVTNQLMQLPVSKEDALDMTTVALRIVLCSGCNATFSGEGYSRYKRVSEPYVVPFQLKFCLDMACPFS